MVEEGQAIETMSLIAIGAAAAISALQFVKTRKAVWLSATAILLWAYLRELDFQKLFTYRSVESIGFYTRPHASLGLKLLVIAILAPFAAAGLHLAWFAKRQFIPALKARQPWVKQLCALLLLVLAALASEKLFAGSAEIFEEVSELGVGAMALLLAWHCRVH